MSDIFSEEMKKEIIKLFDKRMIELKIKEAFDIQKDVLIGIEKKIKSLADDVEDARDMGNDNENSINDNENSIKSIEDMIEDCVKQDDMEQLVGKIMLRLMPNFNEKISKEIKKHLVVIAEFVIKNFKEKE